MEYTTLNQTRHAVKAFTDEKISTDVMKEIITQATLAPSAFNIQSWHFVIVESQDKIKALSQEGKFKNQPQIENAGGVILIFSDTALAQRSKEIAQTAGNEMPESLSEIFVTRYAEMFNQMPDYAVDNLLAINIGFVSMNLMLSIKDHGLEGNVIMGFEHSDKINDILDLDKRYRPELFIVLGKSEDKGHASYRLPADSIIEVK
ncbi:MAG: nitroreductase family protein [Streptococcaceae bacterium]|nr:nitroreductase family protein [Streptococcaceae bacterium]